MRWTEIYYRILSRNYGTDGQATEFNYRIISTEYGPNCRVWLTNTTHHTHTLNNEGKNTTGRGPILVLTKRAWWHHTFERAYNVGLIVFASQITRASARDCARRPKLWHHTSEWAFICLGCTSAHVCARRKNYDIVLVNEMDWNLL